MPVWFVENTFKVGAFGRFGYGRLSCIDLMLLGRGKSSHAYFHSLHEDHHVFINLQTLSVCFEKSRPHRTDVTLTDLLAGLCPSRRIRGEAQLSR